MKNRKNSTGEDFDLMVAYPRFSNTSLKENKVIFIEIYL